MIETIFATGLAALASTSLRGFQNKSVALGNKPLVFGIGAAMNLCDVLVIASVAQSQSPVLMGTTALCAGAGWLVGMYVHDWWTRGDREAAAEIKRLTQHRTIKEIVAKGIAKENKRREAEKAERKARKLRQLVAEEDAYPDELDPRVEVMMDWKDGRGPQSMMMRLSLYDAIKAKAAEERDTLPPAYEVDGNTTDRPTRSAK